MEYLLIGAIVAAVVAFVSEPLRRTRRPDSVSDSALRELEAAREAKFREIKDTELDHRTGKLSDEDYRALDAALRSEAVEILRSIDTIEAP